MPHKELDERPFDTLSASTCSEPAAVAEKLSLTSFTMNDAVHDCRELLSHSFSHNLILPNYERPCSKNQLQTLSVTCSQTPPQAEGRTNGSNVESKFSYDPEKQWRYFIDLSSQKGRMKVRVIELVRNDSFRNAIGGWK